MRRAVVLAVVIVAIGAWLAFDARDGTWAVEARADGLGLGFKDECSMRFDAEDGFGTGGGGNFYILLRASDRQEADAMASCYRAQGFTAEVRRPNADDRTTFDGEVPKCDGSDSRPCTGAAP